MAKYKQLYLDEKDRAISLNYKLRSCRDSLEKLQQENDRLKGFVEKVEGIESDLRIENNWLRTTLRLAILDADKLKHIELRLERDFNSMKEHL